MAGKQLRPTSSRCLQRECGLPIAYLMLSIEIYLASYTLGDFKISYFKMGPTELRILLSIGNIALLYKSVVHLFGRAYRLFDVGGTIGISGMMLVMVISVIHNVARLYRREPLPTKVTGYLRKPRQTGNSQQENQTSLAANSREWTRIEPGNRNP